MVAKSQNKITAKTRRSKERIRDEERIPAVVYGPNRESTPITVNKKEFQSLYDNAGESTLVTLDIQDTKEKPSVLIYDTQKDPMRRDIIHADFLEPNLKEKVEAEVPLVFKGETPLIEEMEGTLVKNADTVDVKALPQELPHEVEVDISNLQDFDDVIYVRDLQIPSNVEIMQEEDTVIAMISKPEDVESELEKPIEEEGEPEVIDEKREEEEEEEGGGEEETEAESEEE